MWLLRIGAFGLLLALLMNYSLDKLKTMLPIKYVRIGGSFQYLTKNKVEKLLLPLVDKGFFAIDLQKIQLSIMSLPWVDKAEVKRIWPDAIAIEIHEQQAVARWKEQALLNKRGEVFAPDDIKNFLSLPVINGMKGQEYKLFIRMREIKNMLVAKGLKLAEFEVNERMSWQLKLDKGTRIQLGQKNPMQKFKRFLNILPILGFAKLDLMKTVDMRYPNGFSILWKSGFPVEWEQHNLDAK